MIQYSTCVPHDEVQFDSLKFGIGNAALLLSSVLKKRLCQVSRDLTYAFCWSLLL